MGRRWNSRVRGAGRVWGREMVVGGNEVRETDYRSFVTRDGEHDTRFPPRHTWLAIASSDLRSHAEVHAGQEGDFT